MTEISMNGLVAIILALQFAAFGWRINREIPVGDAGSKTWFPIPDILNILSMIGVVFFCVLSPLKAGAFTRESKVMLAVAFILMAFYPISMMGHYRLFTKMGRHIYTARNEDYPYCTGIEAILVAFSLLFAFLGAFYML